MWATRLIAGFGAVGLAAHEILRQIWVFSNQAYTSLDIATQVRAASPARRRAAAGAGREPWAGQRGALSRAGQEQAGGPTRRLLPLCPLLLPALQSLVAFHLGKADRRSAAAVFRRTLSLAVFAGVVIMCALLAARTALPSVFTPDAAVVHQVELVRRWGGGLQRGGIDAGCCWGGGERVCHTCRPTAMPPVHATPPLRRCCP